MRHRVGKRSAHRVNAEPSDSDSLGISVIFPNSQSQFSRAMLRKAEGGRWFGREDPDSEILGLMDHHSRPCHHFDSFPPSISASNNNRYLMNMLSRFQFRNLNAYFPSSKSALTATKLSGRRHSRNDVKPDMWIGIRDNTIHTRNFHMRMRQIFTSLKAKQGDNLGRGYRVTYYLMTCMLSDSGKAIKISLPSQS
jgi:hypothetical protein